MTDKTIKCTSGDCAYKVLKEMEKSMDFTEIPQVYRELLFQLRNKLEVEAEFKEHDGNLWVGTLLGLTVGWNFLSMEEALGMIHKNKNSCINSVA